MVATAAMETMAESHRALVATQNRLAASIENQTRVQTIKEQMAGEQMKCSIYQGMGDDNAVRHCLSQIEILQAELAAIMAEPSAREACAIEDHCPVEEAFLNKAPANEEVDLTHAEVDDSSDAEDSEAEQDVEEMYTAVEV
jgi:hypothetical protein